jgi:3-phenylpropionate/trans-cinnamate dioxygenase ferredoxin component
MKFIKAAQTSELTPGNKLKVTVEGKTILLANIDGTFYAIDNKCPHLGGSLSDGNLDGENIVCPKHGAIFSLKSGKNMGVAKILFLKITPNDAKTYPVKIEGYDILIGID